VLDAVDVNVGVQGRSKGGPREVKFQIRRPKQACTGCLTLVWDRIVSDHPASACITLFIAKVASTMPPKPNPYGAAEARRFESWLSLSSQSTDPLPPGSSGALSPRQSTPPHNNSSGGNDGAGVKGDSTRRAKRKKPEKVYKVLAESFSVACIPMKEACLRVEVT
jgi:hypothetical protein